MLYMYVLCLTSVKHYHVRHSGTAVKLCSMKLQLQHWMLFQALVTLVGNNTYPYFHLCSVGVLHSYHTEKLHTIQGLTFFLKQVMLGVTLTLIHLKCMLQCSSLYIVL
jgi:hypothetical protein